MSGLFRTVAMFSSYVGLACNRFYSAGTLLKIRHVNVWWVIIILDGNNLNADSFVVNIFVNTKFSAKLFRKLAVSCGITCIILPRERSFGENSMVCFNRGFSLSVYVPNFIKVAPAI